MAATTTETMPQPAATTTGTTILAPSPKRKRDQEGKSYDPLLLGSTQHHRFTSTTPATTTQYTTNQNQMLISSGTCASPIPYNGAGIEREITSPSMTPFRFTSFPASLPRVHPKKIDDSHSVGDHPPNSPHSNEQQHHHHNYAELSPPPQKQLLFDENSNPSHDPHVFRNQKASIDDDDNFSRKHPCPRTVRKRPPLARAAMNDTLETAETTLLSPIFYHARTLSSSSIGDTYETQRIGNSSFLSNTSSSMDSQENLNVHPAPSLRHYHHLSSRSNLPHTYVHHQQNIARLVGNNSNNSNQQQQQHCHSPIALRPGRNTALLFMKDKVHMNMTFDTDDDEGLAKEEEGFGTRLNFNSLFSAEKQMVGGKLEQQDQRKSFMIYVLNLISC